MKNLLIVNPDIPHYRTAFFDELSRYYNLTIVVENDRKIKSSSFQILNTRSITFVGLKWRTLGLFKLYRRYDIVVLEANIRYIDTAILALLPLRHKIALWGIGLSASYEKRYGEDGRYDRYRFWLFKRFASVILYSHIPIKRLVAGGVNRESISVAHNTVIGGVRIDGPNRDSLLFVGSLYKSKNLDVILRVLAEIPKDFRPNFIIVGEGAERISLEEMVRTLGLSETVEFLGKITDQSKLDEIFSRALACISWGQAGLSVLDSFSRGVCFISTKDAFTGGELFNIQNNKNGYLLDSKSALIRVLREMKIDQEKFVRLGMNALDYYLEERTIEKMTLGFVNGLRNM